MSDMGVFFKLLANIADILKIVSFTPLQFPICSWTRSTFWNISFKY